MLSQLRNYLLTSRVSVPVVGEVPDQAAVLIALTDNAQDPCVVLTRRAEWLTYHSGEVSFPGGKWERQDPSLEHTALRETHEEIGVSPDQVEIVGALPVFQTYLGQNVSPFVGIIPEGLHYTPNLGELDAIFHVPLSFFIEDRRIRTDRFNRELGQRWSPAYDFDGYEIWGFTARVLVGFLAAALDVDIGPEHSAPVVYWNDDQE